VGGTVLIAGAIFDLRNKGDENTIRPDIAIARNPDHALASILVCDDGFLDGRYGRGLLGVSEHSGE